MKTADRGRPPFRVGVFSVVKHDYIARALAAHPRFELVCVADDADRPEWTHERNARFAAEFQIPYLRDVAQALQQFGLHAAVVSSEAERHCDLAGRAAQAGLHIVADKPLSTRIEDCDRLIDALEGRQLQCLVWNRNLVPALLQARGLVLSGALGRLCALHCDFYFAKDAGPPLGSRRPGDPPINWLERQLEAHADGSDGGVGVEPIGELQIEGIYPLAYILMLTGGARPLRVFARAGAYFHQAHADNEVDDFATVTLELERGIIATLCLGRIGAAAHPDLGEIKLHLLGERGAAVIAEPRPEVAVYYREQPPSEFRHRRIGDESNHLLAENFARAIDGTEAPILDARGARDICATVLAAIDSARSGTPAAVNHRAV